MALHRTPIFDFHRGNLILGCERNLLMLLGMLCMVLMVLQTAVSIALAIALWIGGLPLLSMMGKADPHMTKVFARYRKYAEFYPAHSRKNYANRD
ncbi:conjugal transfer protein TrbD (plasmid) [Shewanella sp. SNU WT4]|uniref:conjugal transfer protein TrbD n=1 Tax=Shewanella sp. SNU WT4 TaxID=2590015 RepID=UPI00112B0725|nr:conjugal transfer protein TrbD [Shewanella sp. SNU WT4]QDF68665.1 conjugal transfer protein TrbD [Shewanella sp. SNU WT4]